MNTKTDRNELSTREREQIARVRRVQYAKALRRAGKALIAADVALASVEAFALDVYSERELASGRSEVQHVESLLRTLLIATRAKRASGVR